jgi:hypothetical protein
MKEKDTEERGNVIPFPDSRQELLSVPTTWEAWRFVAPEYDLNNHDDFVAYMAAEAHVALKIQGLFGVEEANAWVQFHRGIYQPGDNGAPEDGE